MLLRTLLLALLALLTLPSLPFRMRERTGWPSAPIRNLCAVDDSVVAGSEIVALTRGARSFVGRCFEDVEVGVFEVAADLRGALRGLVSELVWSIGMKGGEGDGTGLG